MGSYLTDDQIALINNAMPSNQIAGLGTLLDRALAGVLPTGSISTSEIADAAVTTDKEIVTPFSATATLTAAAAATPVTIVADAAVPAGKKIYVTNLRLVVSGATAWTDATATKVTIQDTNSSPVAVVDIAKAGLTSNAVISTLGGTNQTLGANIIAGSGLTAAKGIVIKGDANFGAGSDIKVTVSGVIK